MLGGQMNFALTTTTSEDLLYFMVIVRGFVCLAFGVQFLLGVFVVSAYYTQPQVCGYDICVYKQFNAHEAQNY